MAFVEFMSLGILWSLFGLVYVYSVEEGKPLLFAMVADVVYGRKISLERVQSHGEVERTGGCPDTGRPIALLISKDILSS